MDNFAICLAFIVFFSVWQTARSITGISINVGGISTYPEYIFIILAYVAFIAASYRVLKISEEFGFKEDGKKIEQIISEKQSGSLQKTSTTKIQKKQTTGQRK